MKLVAKI